MKRWNHKGADRLRRGRVSVPEARYFITVTTGSRIAGLTAEPIASSILQALRVLQKAGDIDLFCATIMPDHAHACFRLGRRLSLSQTVAKWKAKSEISSHSPALFWQDNFHDHRLRPDEEMEPFARYTFMNPYRKGLLKRTDSWPWWVCHRDYVPEFMAVIRSESAVPSQWVKDAPTARELIESSMLNPDASEGTD